MDTKAIVREMQAKMKKVIEHTLHEFNTLHTGKACPSMLEGVMVDAYGTGPTPLRNLAAINTPDASMISLEPWDKSTLRAIEKAIQAANLGLNPIVQGSIIRCPIPKLSGERRQELVKRAKEMAEKGRISLRNIRREVLEVFKGLEKDSKLSKDDVKLLEKDVQHTIDASIKEIDQHLEHKDKDLLEVK